jgi:3-hydroxyacyl-CoA dehydrogenase/enoyl-CoA hydratase/3-hydroxybutyryl-CoA epimerase
MSDEETIAPWRRDDGPGGLCTLWFDYPGRTHNVLNGLAFEELDQHLAAIESDPAVRGVLIRSSKAAGFCAGADLKTVLGCTSAAQLKEFFARGLEVLDRLARLKVPTVAVVHGVCLGGGLELALACRRRVALASNVPIQLGSPEVQIGLVPSWGAITRLPRLIAPKDALNLLLVGAPIGFLQAKSQGLVDRLVAQDEQDRIAETLQGDPPQQRPMELSVWRSELEFAAVKIEEQPADFPEVQKMIMEIIEIDLASGPQAANAAAVQQCAELALEPATREAISNVLNRRRGGT